MSLVHGDESPPTILVYGRNQRQVQIKLRQWVTTTANDPRSGERSNAAWIDPGEEKELAEVPVSNIGITANILRFDDQRIEDQGNVLLEIDPKSEVFSEDGYVITILSEPVEHTGKPDEPVGQESVPSNESVAADYIRIAPRPSGETP